MILLLRSERCTRVLQIQLWSMMGAAEVPRSIACRVLTRHIFPIVLPLGCASALSPTPASAGSGKGLHRCANSVPATLQGVCPTIAPVTGLPLPYLLMHVLSSFRPFMRRPIRAQLGGPRWSNLCPFSTSSPQVSRASRTCLGRCTLGNC